jgi:hypothetical protein
MTAARNGQRQERRQVPGASANYTQLVGGVATCARCAALIPDTRPSRDQHDQFHAALRAMYERLGGRS